MALAQHKLQMALNGVSREDLVKDEGFREDTRKAMQDALRALPSLDW
jgi:hypothetical protein